MMNINNINLKKVKIGTTGGEFTGFIQKSDSDFIKLYQDTECLVYITHHSIQNIVPLDYNFKLPCSISNGDVTDVIIRLCNDIETKIPKKILEIHRDYILTTISVEYEKTIYGDVGEVCSEKHYQAQLFFREMYRYSTDHTNHLKINVNDIYSITDLQGNVLK